MQNFGILISADFGIFKIAESSCEYLASSHLMFSWSLWVRWYFRVTCTACSPFRTSRRSVYYREKLVLPPFFRQPWPAFSNGTVGVYQRSVDGIPPGTAASFALYSALSSARKATIDGIKPFVSRSTSKEHETRRLNPGSHKQNWKRVKLIARNWNRSVFFSSLFWLFVFSII